MVGADPKFQTIDRADRVAFPDVPRYARSLRWRWIAVVSTLVPLSFVLVQCGQAPSAGMVAANSQAATGDSFEDRFPKPQFNDRFPTGRKSLMHAPCRLPPPH